MLLRKWGSGRLGLYCGRDLSWRINLTNLHFRDAILPRNGLESHSNTGDQETAMFGSEDIDGVNGEVTIPAKESAVLQAEKVARFFLAYVAARRIVGGGWA